MAIFVTSNMQLGRPTSMKKYKRDFESVDDMNTHLINSWNDVVKPGDVVYHLGNFAWDPKTAQDTLLRLNGEIKILVAEHDKPIEILAEKNMLRSGVSIVTQVEVLDTLKCVLSYWPLQAWPNKSKRYYSIIGYPDKKFKSDPKTRVINISSDLWNNKPQDLERIIEIFKDI